MIEMMTRILLLDEICHPYMMSLSILIAKLYPTDLVAMTTKRMKT
jgi:hypothetical protein